MFLIDRLAEERIAQAINRGDLDDLPGNGEPLELDDDSHVPVELRAAYRLLKNAGFVPPEIQWRREMNEIETSLAQLADEQQRSRALKRLLVLRLQLEKGGRSGRFGIDKTYRDQLLQKLAE